MKQYLYILIACFFLGCTTSFAQLTGQCTQGEDAIDILSAPAPVAATSMHDAESYPITLYFADDTNPLDPPEPDTDYIYYNVPLSDDLQQFTQDLCEAFGVDFRLVLAMMAQESYYDTNSISKANDNGSRDWGIMQINSLYHGHYEEVLGITDWLDPYQNIYAGIYILADYAYLDDYQTMAMFYNTGPGTGKEYVQAGYFNTHSEKVMGYYEELEGKVRG